MATIKKAQWGERVGRARGQKCGLEKAAKREDRMYARQERRLNRQFERQERRDARQAAREERRGPKFRGGGKVTTAKKGGSFPDLNKDGKITKADILKGRGVIKNGGKLKKAQKGTKVDTAVSYKKNPFAQMELQKKKKEAAFNKLRSLPKSKVGGRVSKMMGGGKCRGGCY